MMSTTFDSDHRQAWYLGHSAWLIDTGRQLLLFDYGRVPERPASGSLADGIFDLAAVGDRSLTVFFSHQHGDHYSPDLHRQLAEQQGHQVIVGLDQRQKIRGLPLERTFVMRPHDSLPHDSLPQGQAALAGNMVIHASGSTDSGVSFLVVTPEMTCYHGGDLAAWDDTDWFRETYRREIDWLADRLSETGRTLDVAMLPVSTSDGYQEDALLDGLDYALEKLRPRQVLPMHAFGFETLYQAFIDREQSKKTAVPVHHPITYPHGGILLL